MLVSTPTEEMTDVQLDQLIAQLERTGNPEHMEHAAELRRFKMLTKREKVQVMRQLHGSSDQ